MTAVALCAAVLALGPHAAVSDAVAQAACAQVVASARAHAVDPVIAAALAWEESRLSPDAHSKAGAHGVMQVMPPLRRGRVDLIGSGVRELARLLGRHSIERAICHYNGGRTCSPRSLRWARAVLRTARRLRTSLEDRDRAVSAPSSPRQDAAAPHDPSLEAPGTPGAVETTTATEAPWLATP